MKTYFKTGEFTDYRGELHKFVIAGVVRKCYPNSYAETYDYDAQQKEIFYGDRALEKCLSIGISICNPKDGYNEQIGKMQAEGRANVCRKPELCRQMFVTKSGMLSNEMVEAALEITAKAIVDNPGQFIKGYNTAERKWKEGITSL